MYSEPLFYIHWRELKTGREGRTQTPCPREAAEQAIMQYQQLSPETMEMFLELAEPNCEFVTRKIKIEMPFYEYV